MGQPAVMPLVTMQLWYALKRPPIHHPLFRRVSRRQASLTGVQLTFRGRLLLAALLFGVLYVSLRFYAQLIFVALFFIPLGIAGIYMALHGTIAGLYWATRVSSAIARERERGTYELLSTSPYGAFSANWAICTGCQYYDQTFNGAGSERVWYSRIFFLTLLGFSGLISLIDPRLFDHPLERLGYVTIIISVLALAFLIDDIHSTVMGSLVGLIVPFFARHRLDARVSAFALFLLLQITAYALVWLIAFLLIPPLQDRLPVSAAVALPLVQFLVFFAVREVMARILWRLNALLLNGEVSDLRLMTKGGRLIW